MARAKKSTRDVAKASEELGRSIIALLLKEPFYGHLLSGVVRRVTDSTETAAVALTSQGIELRINPTFFVKTIRRKNERVAIIKHEVLHLVLKHLFRADNLNPTLYNLAADLVVNQLVRPWPLPEGAILLSTFPDLKLKPDQTTDWYYKRLASLERECRKAYAAMPGAGSGEGSGEGSGDDSGEDSGEGSGGGRPDFSQTSAPRSAEALDRLMGSSWHSDHQFWAQGKGSGEGDEAVGSAVPSTLRRAMESELERQIIQTRDRVGAKGWGLLPGMIQQAILTIIERRKPSVDWRRSLRLFTASSRRTQIKVNQKKESKRFESLPGLKRYPGLKIKRFQHMLVAIDTSGSVSNEVLSLFFAEIHGMWRQGAEVDVIECDAAVQRVYPYKGRLPKDVCGRGGTRFDPVFEWIKAQRRGKYDGCIYLTDGYAAAPQINPRCRVLWVVTADGSIGPHLRYGRAIQLPPP